MSAAKMASGCIIQRLLRGIVGGSGWLAARGPQEIGQTGPLQHVIADPVDDREGHRSAILAGVDMDPERPFAEGRVDDVGNGPGDGAEIGVVRCNPCQGSLDLPGDAGARARLVGRRTRVVIGASRSGEVGRPRQAKRPGTMIEVSIPQRDELAGVLHRQRVHPGLRCQMQGEVGKAHRRRRCCTIPRPEVPAPAGAYAAGPRDSPAGSRRR